MVFHHFRILSGPFLAGLDPFLKGPGIGVVGNPWSIWQMLGNVGRVIAPSSCTITFKQISQAHPKQLPDKIKKT